MTEKILMDGAMGTQLWKKAAERGLEKTPVWMYSLTAPDMVREVHAEYLAAGASLILTDTFTVNRPELSKYPGHTVEKVVEKALSIAHEAVNDHLTRTGKKALIGLDSGPLPGMLEPFGDIEEDEACEYYREIFNAGKKAGFDLIALETFYDLPMMEVAAKCAKEQGVPVLCSMTFEKSGRTFMGYTPEAIVESLTEIGVDAIGLNCSVGPRDARPVIEKFASLTDKPLILKANAASSDENVLKMPYTSDMYIEELKPVLPLVTYIGSCCGTDPEYTGKIAALL